MSHNIFNERFFSLREPAWHGLGIVSETPMGAVEAYSSILPIHVRLEELRTVETGFDIGMNAIVRDPVPDDPEQVLFGVVGPDYELITPHQICEMFDRVVDEAVETIGVLGRGETFFLTVKMPDSEVNGDEINNYLLIDAPMTGTEANHVRIAPTRVVCQNTLMVARRLATQAYRIKHTAGAAERMEAWMAIAYGKAEEMLEHLGTIFFKLTLLQLQEKEAKEVLELVYPDPKPPRQDAPSKVMETRRANWEYNREWYRNTRSLAFELFNGVGLGQDTKAASGTGWGLYNAVVELEDFRGAGRGGKNPLARQRDAIFGYRAKAKARAFQLLVDMMD